MDGSNGYDFPRGLEGVRRRFERWRRTHPVRSRIPESLWSAAARAADQWGVHRTCRALRLDYHSLKERVERQSTAVHRPARTAATFPTPAPSAIADQGPLSLPTFLELGRPGPIGPCECTLEWENAAGCKMRIHLKNSPMPDLAALSRNFWNPAS
jgi:hypothetical protein